VLVLVYWQVQFLVVVELPGKMVSMVLLLVLPLIY
jgi:hypothetical protein